MTIRILVLCFFLLTTCNLLQAQTQAEIESLLLPSSSKELVKDKSSQKEPKEKTEKAPSKTKEKQSYTNGEEEKLKEVPIKASKEKTAKKKELDIVKKNTVEANQGKQTKEKAPNEAKLAVDKVVKEEKSNLEMEKTVSKSPTKFKYKTLKKQGDEFFMGNAFEKSADIYKNALTNSKKTKQKLYLLSRITQCYMALRDYPETQKYAEQLITLDKKSSQELAYYWLANAQVYQADYKNAKNNFIIFGEKSENAKNLDFEKSKARLGIKSCDYAIELVSSRPQFTIENLSDNVNGPYADFGPAIKGNELVFSKIKTDDFDKNDLDNVAKIYTSTLFKGEYELAQEFSNLIKNFSLSLNNCLISVKFLSWLDLNFKRNIT